MGAHDWEGSAESDRALIRKEAEAMNIDLNKAIVKAIQIGEAKSQEVLDRGMTNVNAMGRAMMIEIAEQVERMADNVLKTVSEDRQTMANNYLSLKGYAGAGQDTILEYIQKGGGSRKGLNSIGDFKTKPAEGVSAGAGELIAPFSGDIVPEVKEINKVNGLCDEYMQVYAAVRARWPYGIGKYMLVKLADSMTKEGVLRVGSKSGSSGQWVMMNAKTLGLPTSSTSSTASLCASPTTRTSWISSPPFFPTRRSSLHTLFLLLSTRVIKQWTMWQGQV